jgi:hypothetical protein
VNSHGERTENCFGRADNTPELELVKEAGKVTIYEADDMDRQVSVPVSLIPQLIRALDELK